MDFDSLISQEADKTQVYIAYGLVMNQVQECELAMVQMYYAIKLIKGKIRSVKDKDELYTKLLKDTFGSLVKVLSDQCYLDKTIIEKLQKIKPVRDNLAHNFFKENLPELRTVKGRKLITNGMSFTYKTIGEVNSILEQEMTKIFVSLNFTQEEIKGFVEGNTKGWLINKSK
jgi:hypothetical protein